MQVDCNKYFTDDDLNSHLINKTKVNNREFKRLFCVENNDKSNEIKADLESAGFIHLYFTGEIGFTRKLKRHLSERRHKKGIQNERLQFKKMSKYH